MSSKKSNKPGAVKYFNDKKAEAFKSAARAMKAFKKSLPKAQLGPTMGPQNNYWFNSPEKRAMSDAQDRYAAAGERSSNYDENAQKEYKALIDNYKAEGPTLPLADQVAALNKKYPYYNNIVETPFKGGSLNKGWDAMYKAADKSDYTRSKALKDPYPNVGTGLVRKKGGQIKSKSTRLKVTKAKRK